MQKPNLKLIEQQKREATLSKPSAARRGKAKGALTPVLTQILEAVQVELAEKADDGALPTSEQVEQFVAKHAERIGMKLAATERDEILAQVEANNRPFGVLQELVDDESISDIIVYGPSKVTIQVGRQNHRTNTVFPSQKAYENFVERLLAQAGSTYSTKQPEADGMIGDYARIHVMHKCLCETGPYLTIRINRFGSISVEDLIQFGSAPRPIFEYLEGLVKVGRTILVVGEVGSGKTTLLRALASGVGEEECILVIEDTPEIRLDHPFARYVHTRDENTEGAGRISPSRCIRSGMRMAMNRVIFGEMRDAEAAESFVDVCASGHPGLSTIHAKSAVDAIARLELFLGRAQPGVTRKVILDQISTAVSCIVYVDICKRTGKRRVMEVKEINGASDGAIRQRDIAVYDGSKGIPEWKLKVKQSSFSDELKRNGIELDLACLPSEITLEDEVLFREAAAAGARV